MLGASHKMIAFISRISQSARDLGAAKAGLKTQIKHFSNGSQNCSSHELATRLFQQALLIFLRTTFHGLRTPDQTLYDQIVPCVYEFLQCMLLIPRSSTSDTTLKLSWDLV